jgi:hypothetical protein
VHQLLRQLAPEYWKRFGPAMPQRHRQVLRKILSCRTPALGGELFQCPDCPAFDYLARYVFKSATANKSVLLRPDGKVRWDYRDSKTGQPAAISLDPLVWMSRFLQHVLPSGFARVRTFGWLHPAAKVRANRVRALLGENPVLTPAEQAAWQPPLASPLEPAPEEPPPERCGPLCPRCRQKMRRVGSWLPGHAVLLPKQPP